VRKGAEGKRGTHRPAALGFAGRPARYRPGRRSHTGGNPKSKGRQSGRNRITGMAERCRTTATEQRKKRTKGGFGPARARPGPSRSGQGGDARLVLFFVLRRSSSIVSFRSFGSSEPGRFFGRQGWRGTRLWGIGFVLVRGQTGWGVKDVPGGGPTQKSGGRKGGGPALQLGPTARLGSRLADPLPPMALGGDLGKKKNSFPSPPRQRRAKGPLFCLVFGRRKGRRIGRKIEYRAHEPAGAGGRTPAATQPGRCSVGCVFFWCLCFCFFFCLKVFWVRGGGGFSGGFRSQSGPGPRPFCTAASRSNKGAGRAPRRGAGGCAEV